MKKTLIAALMMGTALTASAQSEWFQNVKFSGYGMVQYQASDQEDTENNGFNLRLVRMALEGRAHDGLTDARNTADLYRQTQDSEQFARLKALIDEMQRPHTTALGDLVDLSGWDLPSE